MFSFINDNVHYMILIVTLLRCYNLDYNNTILFIKMCIIAVTNFGLKKLAGDIIPKLTQNDFILNTVLYRPGTTKSGFPSGHCMVVFSIIPLLIDVYQKYVTNLIMLYGIFIGYDRVMKRQHTYTQVILGAIVGLGMGVVLFRF